MTYDELDAALGRLQAVAETDDSRDFEMYNEEIRMADLRAVAEARRMLREIASLPDDLDARNEHASAALLRQILTSQHGGSGARQLPKAQASDVLGAGSVEDAGSANPATDPGSTPGAAVAGERGDELRMTLWRCLRGGPLDAVPAQSLVNQVYALQCHLERDHAIAEAAREYANAQRAAEKQSTFDTVRRLAIATGAFYRLVDASIKEP